VDVIKGFDETDRESVCHDVCIESGTDGDDIIAARVRDHGETETRAEREDTGRSDLWIGVERLIEALMRVMLESSRPNTIFRLGICLEMLCESISEMYMYLVCRLCVVGSTQSARISTKPPMTFLLGFYCAEWWGELQQSCGTCSLSLYICVRCYRARSALTISMYRENNARESYAHRQQDVGLEASHPELPQRVT